MIGFRIIGLVAIYTGLSLILQGLGIFPEGWSLKWWQYSIGIFLVVTPLYMVYNEFSNRKDKR